MLPEATLQVSYLKDLVTLADPTNPYSFLSFLFKEKRFYRFLHADFQRVTRKEYNQYLQWGMSSTSDVEIWMQRKCHNLRR